MDLIALSWIDYILFSVVFGGSCALGIYFGCCGNRQQTKTEYLLGGRTMAVTPVAVSLIASTLSSSSLLGIPTEIYFYGTQYWMMCLSVLIAGLSTNYIFLPVFYKLGITTLYEYLELRFNIHVRRIVSFLYFLESIILMPCIVYAPALALNQISGFDIHIIAIILAATCIFYTALGGLRGVVWSSTIQFGITLGTLCAIIGMGFTVIGGWSEIWENMRLGDRLELFNVNPDPTLRATFWSVVIGNMCIWTNYTATNPAAIQRLLALPRLSDSRKTLLAYTAGTIIAKSLCCFTGVIMYAKYYTCDPLSAGYVKRRDQVLPYYVLDVATRLPGISGLFIAAMLSTTLSALSSLINTLSGTIYMDLIERLMPTKITEKAASNTIKGISVVLGIVTVGLIFVIEKLGTILQLIVSFSGIVAGPAVGVYSLGLFFPVANSKGALSGAATSICFMWYLAIGRYITNVDGTDEYLPKPFPSYECNNTAIDLITSIQATDPERSEPMWLYRVSFYYYGFMGAVITLIVGLIVSYITNKGKKPVPLDYLSPLIHCFVRKNVSKVTLQDNINDAQKDVTAPFINFRKPQEISR